MTALLVGDLESTGLNPRTLTVLECAWTICDIDGTQRLPLRSRYTAITAAGEDNLVVPLRRAGGEWSNRSHGSSFALRMAEDSLLFSDWSACPDDQIVRSGAELERLILDDIAAVVDPGEPNPDYRLVNPPGTKQWLREPERLHLAGAGVAQFDQPVLRLLCPRVIPDFGRAGPTHYRPVDVSIAQTAMLGGSEDEKMIAWALREYEFGSNGNITQIQVGSPPQYAYPRPLNVLSQDKAHRAAEDVARAIVIQRALWRYAAPLREALGIPR